MTKRRNEHITRRVVDINKQIHEPYPNLFYFVSKQSFRG